MRRPSVVRAWLVAHDALPVAAATTVVALALSVGSEHLLPVPGSVRVVPLWQLTPPVMATLTSLATVSRLPEDLPGPALRGARACWAAALGGIACGAVALVGAGSGLPSLVPATALLVGLTLAAACLVGRTSVWVGGAGVLVVVLHTGRYAGTANPWAPGAGPLWTLGAPVAVLGTAAYWWFGARNLLIRTRSD